MSVTVVHSRHDHPGATFQRLARFTPINTLNGVPLNHKAMAMMGAKVGTVEQNAIAEVKHGSQTGRQILKLTTAATALAELAAADGSRY